jgi:hypothetical protein
MLSIHLIFTVLALTKVLFRAEVAHYIEPSTKEEDGVKVLKSTGIHPYKHIMVNIESTSIVTKPKGIKAGFYESVTDAC